MQPYLHALIYLRGVHRDNSAFSQLFWLRFRRVFEISSHLSQTKENFIFILFSFASHITPVCSFFYLISFFLLLLHSMKEIFVTVCINRGLCEIEKLNIVGVGGLLQRKIGVSDGGLRSHAFRCW